MFAALLAALVRALGVRGVEVEPGLGVGLTFPAAMTGAWWRRWPASGGFAHRFVRWVRRGRPRAGA